MDAYNIVLGDCSTLEELNAAYEAIAIENIMFDMINEYDGYDNMPFAVKLQFLTYRGKMYRLGY